MKIQTFLVVESEEILVFEEFYDQNRLLKKSIDHKSKEKRTVNYEYDNRGLLIKETEITRDVSDVVEFDYDQDRRITEQRVFINKNLYEIVKTEYKVDGFVHSVYREGEEVLKEIRKNKNPDGDDYVAELYDCGQLLEVHNRVYDPVKKRGVIKLFDKNGFVFGKLVDEFNDDDLLTMNQEFDKNENLLRETFLEYKNKLLLREVVRDFSYDSEEYIVTFSYDKNDNEVLKEVHSMSNELLEFHRKVVDEEGNLLEEAGYSRGNFSAIYGNYISDDHFYFIHKYI